MKFPRTAKTLGSQSDAAPYAAVFFLLVIFLLLGALIPTPGVPLNLPAADNLPGTDKPTVAVAIDASNRLYFSNQLVSEAQLKSSLSNRVHQSFAPLTLVIQADKAVSYEQLLRTTLLARDIGITNALLATLPGVGTTRP